MSFLTGFKRGLRVLFPLLAIVGLVFTNAAPANADVVNRKLIQVFVPGHGTTERINIRRVSPAGETTQVLANGPITTGQWTRVDSSVTVGETVTVTLYRLALGAWVPYKEFVTVKVPADDKQFFWIDSGRY